MISYSTETSSSHLRTKSPGFVLNRNLKFAVGYIMPRICTQPKPQVRSWVHNASYLYSTGTSSSYLGTISHNFVLNWNLKFALGNKKPRFCTQLDPQVLSWEQKAPFLYSTGIPATSFRRDIPDCPVVLPNSCSSISLLRHFVAGQCAAIVEIGRCRTSTGLLRSCRAVQCAATLDTELRRAVTVGVLHKTTLLRPSWGCCVAVLGKRGRIE